MKSFELTNHLGNVLATVSDNKRQHSSDGTDVDFYTADVLSAQNYYPFGMQMMGIPGGLVEEPVVPPVVLEEEDYTTGTGGWASYNAATVTNDNGRVKVTTDIVWGIAQKELNLVQGKRYRVRFTLDMGNCKMLSVIMWDPITQTYVRMSGTGSALSSGGSYEGTFEAEAARTLFLFEVVPGYGNPVPDSTAYFWIDDFYIEEYTPVYGVTPRNYWSSVKEENGRLKVIGTKPWAEARKFIDVTAGKKYRLRYNADLGNCAYLHIIVANPADGSYVWVPSTGGITTGGNYSGTFTAAADLLEIRFQMPALPAGESTGYFYLDDIYLEEVVEVEGGGSVNGGGYRYGYQGSEKVDEIAGSGNHYTTYFRELDVRIAHWWTPDPKASAHPWQSPYVVNGNNPVLMIDPNGDKEYESLKAYRKTTGNKKLGKGDWLTSDRTDKTDIWKNANAFNLQQEKGFNEYTNIEQRAAFYGWFQTTTDAKGFETKWAGAASVVASNVNMLTKGWVQTMGYSNDAAAALAEAGNRMIFEDVFPKLTSLYNGSPLTGKAAFNWDAMALSQEQNLIQPLYKNTPAFGLISGLAKQKLIFSSRFATVPPFPANGNMMNVGQRWKYGMGNMGYKVQISNMPDAGANYKSYYDYKLQQYILSPQYQKLRRAGASGSW